MPRCLNPGARYHEKLAAASPEEAEKMEANRRAKMSAGIRKTRAIQRIVNAVLKAEVDPNSYQTDISISVSKLRLMIEDLISATDQYAVSYDKTLRGGVIPGQLSSLGRDVYMRSSIMLDYVCQIEEALKRFDIHPE